MSTCDYCNGPGGECKGYEIHWICEEGYIVQNPEALKDLIPNWSREDTDEY